LHLHAIPAGVDQVDGDLTLVTEDGKRFGPFDSLIWAVGRRPLTQSLGLEAAGVAMDDGGFIATDEFQQTSVANIFAVGDVTGCAGLTPVAIAAGRRLADRLYGGMAERHLDYTNIPSVVFTHPPIGTCGLTEREARTQYGDEVAVYSSEFVPMINSFTEHRTKASMKPSDEGQHETRDSGCGAKGRRHPPVRPGLRRDAAGLRRRDAHGRDEAGLRRYGCDSPDQCRGTGHDAVGGDQ